MPRTFDFFNQLVELMDNFPLKVRILSVVMVLANTNKYHFLA